MKKYIILASLLALFSISAIAQDTTPTLDSGNTAWMIVATAFVLMMTIPGLALFYGGLVRRKNVLSVFMQCFILVAVMSLEWVIIGYSMAFSSSEGFLKPFVGGLDHLMLKGIGINNIESTGIPTLIFVLFQGMFAVITPALIIGAFAERIKFSGFLVFSVLWGILIYNPLAHWVWSSDGWLFNMGALDFAGGTVVHINAGIAALVMAIALGKRRGYKGHAMPPHNIPFVAMGAALLWIGWFGFNAGSGLAADGLAANALMVTHIAAAAAALTWALLDWFIDKRPTIIGISTGAVAGLVAITPAAGFVGVGGAIIIGIAVSVICFVMVAYVKPKLGYDDSLDAFGVHGVGGIIGAILTGILANPFIQSSYSGAIYGNFHQLWIQLLAVGATIIFSGVGTFIIFKITDKIVGIRAIDKHEAIGLDETQHGETAYTNFD